ncbi:MAG: cobalt-precorrin 5A hydrolase, partial [Egibacteraceae bacterium]
MIAVIAATKAGRRLAADIAAHLDGKLVDGPVRQAVAAAWAEADQLVLVMAAGAAVRLIAPLLASKHTDPGVVVVDDAGRFAVSLAGGHEGGANALAGRIASYLGAAPVVTTGSEVHGAAGLADLGMAVDPEVADLAAVGGALLSGERVALVNRPRWPLGPLPETVVEVAQPAGPLVWVTDLLVDPPRPAVVLRPPSLVVGVGASRGVDAGEVRALISRALREAGLSPASVHCLATVDAKAGEQGIVEAAARLGVPLVTLPVDRLAAIPVPNPSAVVAAAVGTP